MAIDLENETSTALAFVFGAAMLIFVWRSFYEMRITADTAPSDSESSTAAASSAQ
jgi:hypothetical protein